MDTVPTDQSERSVLSTITFVLCLIQHHLYVQLSERFYLQP